MNQGERGRDPAPCRPPSRRGRVPLPLLFAASLGVLFLVLLRWSSGPRNPRSTHGPVETKERVSGASLRVPEEDPKGHPEGRSPSSSRPPSTDPEPDGEPVAWVLKGSIQCEEDFETNSFEVLVYQGGHLRISEIPLNPDHSFFSPLQPRLPQNGADLRIEARLLGLPVAETVVSFPPSPAGAPNGEQRTLRCSLVVTTRSIVTGRVLGPSGAPIEGATVGFFGRGADGELSPRSRVRTGEDGRFTVKETEPGRVLAVAQHGYRPLTLSPTLAPPVTEIGTLTLSDQEVLEGRLLLPASLPAGANEVLVRRVEEPETSDAPPTFLWGSLQLRWMHGFLEWPQASAPCDERGRFAITGLAPGAYRLSYYRWNGDSCPFGRRLTSVEVIAPAHGILLDRIAPLVMVRAKDPAGIPLDGVSLKLLSDGRDALIRGGRLLIQVSTETSLRFELSKPGYASRELEVPAMANGEYREIGVELQSLDPPGSLVVRLPNDPGVDVLEVSLRPRSPIVPPWSRFPLRRENGEFRIDEVAAGQYSVRVTPAFSNALSSLQRMEDSEVDVDPGKTSTLDVRWETGAGLDLRVVDEAGAALPASCTITSAFSPEVPLDIEFARGDSLGSYRDPRVVHRPGDPEGFVRVLPPLEPGIYHIEARLDSYVPAMRDVRVVSNSTVEVTLVLVPERPGGR